MPWLNKKGGIKGEKLQIVKYDDACDPKQAVAVANKVVNDGIKYVIGHLCSSSTQPASDIYEDEGILMITPAATAPELTARGYNLEPGDTEESGIRQMISKPFSPRQLLTAVNEVLGIAA